MSGLILENLVKEFERKCILDGLSYTFPERGLFLILGESGSGKTTLLRMIAGLDTDYTGSITGGGMTAVSMAFQEHRLLPSLTALGNVTEALIAERLPRAEATEQAKHALLSLGYPEADFGLRPAALSGGMRQRVSLARAFAASRPILLLDEPEKELDEPLRERLYTRIREEAARRLVLVVTHTPERLLPYADGTLTVGAKFRDCQPLR